jgi:bacteriocin-like protein
MQTNQTKNGLPPTHQLKLTGNTIMNNEITTQVIAIELSEQELDNVSGGLSINFGDVNSFASTANNSFRKKTSLIEQGTFANEHGSGTMSSVGIEDIFSAAGQGIVIG